MLTNVADNIRRINELWGIHDIDEECLYFFVDPRYCLYDCPVPFELRLGVSYGSNPFTEAMTNNVFVPPPYKPGPYLFGIHGVGVLNAQLTLYDQWAESRAANLKRLQFEEAKSRAMEILEEFYDEKYARHLIGTGSDAEVIRSSLFSLDELEVVHAEAF